MAEHPRHVVAVTGFVEDADGHVLLVRVATRGWEMPGGQVELGEDPADALVREIEEETGIGVEVERLRGVYSKLSEPEMLLLLFSCRYLGGEPRPCTETPEVGWFAPDEARRLVAAPPSARRLQDALEPPAGGIPFRTYRLRPYEEVSSRLV